MSRYNSGQQKGATLVALGTSSTQNVVLQTGAEQSECSRSTGETRELGSGDHCASHHQRQSWRPETGLAQSSCPCPSESESASLAAKWE